MLLRIAHDHDDPLVVVVPLARPAATETFHLLTSHGDVVDLDVEVDAHLRDLRLPHPLEGQPRPVIEARANGSPPGIVAVFGGDRHVQQRTPEGRQPRGVHTVDRDSSPAMCHAYTLAPDPPLPCPIRGRAVHPSNGKRAARTPRLAWSPAESSAR